MSPVTPAAELFQQPQQPAFLAAGARQAGPATARAAGGGGAGGGARGALQELPLLAGGGGGGAANRQAHGAGAGAAAAAAGPQLTSPTGLQPSPQDAAAGAAAAQVVTVLLGVQLRRPAPAGANAAVLPPPQQPGKEGAAPGVEPWPGVGAGGAPLPIRRQEFLHRPDAAPPPQPVYRAAPAAPLALNRSGAGAQGVGGLWDAAGDAARAGGGVRRSREGDAFGGSGGGGGGVFGGGGGDGGGGAAAAQQLLSKRQKGAAAGPMVIDLVEEPAGAPVEQANVTPRQPEPSPAAAVVARLLAPTAAAAPGGGGAATATQGAPAAAAAATTTQTQTQLLGDVQAATAALLLGEVAAQRQRLQDQVRDPHEGNGDWNNCLPGLLTVIGEVRVWCAGSAGGRGAGQGGGRAAGIRRAGPAVLCRQAAHRQTGDRMSGPHTFAADPHARGGDQSRDRWANPDPPTRRRCWPARGRCRTPAARCASGMWHAPSCSRHWSRACGPMCRTWPRSPCRCTSTATRRTSGSARVRRGAWGGSEVMHEPRARVLCCAADRGLNRGAGAARARCGRCDS